MRVENEHSGLKLSWEQVLASLEDGVITVDVEGKITFFNESAEVLTDSSASRTLHQPFSGVFKRDLWLVRLLEKSRPPNQESVRCEADIVDRWDRKVPVSVTISPLQDRFGQFLGSILVLRNLTHRRELEEDLKRADRLAMVGTLAAGLAHEIRNPLGGIRGAAQLLRRSLQSAPSLIEYTDIMIREVDRVDQLIEQLLDLSRPARLALGPLNIHEILDDVLLLQTQTLADQRVGVRKRFDPSLPPVRGDKAQLTQVFLNLVKNALQAMSGGGALTITTRAETDFHIRNRRAGRSRFIWVDIEDEGSGIKEEDLPHIFSPYFTTKNIGTGLGLAVSYRIIKEHGGLIRVESAEGQGTTFKISLVVAD